jgi:hypothetical protein
MRLNYRQRFQLRLADLTLAVHATARGGRCDARRTGWLGFG